MDPEHDDFEDPLLEDDAIIPPVGDDDLLLGLGDDDKDPLEIEDEPDDKLLDKFGFTRDDEEGLL